MTHRGGAPVFLKHLLFSIALVFAAAAILLTIFLTSAATATGSSPAAAISLVSGVNTGILGPGEQRWFKISAAGSTVSKSLTLTFSPAPGQYLSMQLFDEDQTQFFRPDDTSRMKVFGVGQPVSDNSPGADTLHWAGNLAVNTTYYVQVLNNSDFAVDYWLVAEDTAGGSTAQAIASVVEEAEISVAAAPQPATHPAQASQMLPGLNTATLPPHTIHWYTFTHDDPANSNQIQNLDFSLFFTPDDGNRRHAVNFELFTASAVETWLRGDQDRLNNFGAGMLVSRDGDAQTGERIWNGTVLRGENYYLAVENNSDVTIDYWLFDDNIYTPQLGATTKPAPAPEFAPGQAPQTAIPLEFGQNSGGLKPGQQIWYSFSVSNPANNEYFEEMALTMITTPSDGNRIHHINFNVFTAHGVKNWSPQNNSNIFNVGAGSLVVRDNNALTGERFWAGWVVENDLYYVQIQNGADTPIDYWLFTGDVYGPELGP